MSVVSGGRLRLDDLARALAYLIAVLRIPKTTWKPSEKIERLALEHPISVSRLAFLKPPIWQPLAAHRSIKLRILSEDGNNVLLAIDARTAQQAIDALRTTLAGAGVQQVTVDLTIDKTALLEELEVQDPHARFVLYLLPLALEAALGKPLDQVEKHVLGRCLGDRKLLVFLPLVEIQLDGEYFAVLGGRAADGWHSLCPKSPPDQAHVQSFHLRALDMVNWLRFNLAVLTPLQLMVQSSGDSPDKLGKDLGRALFIKLAILSVAYTAGQVRAPHAPGGSWTATYAADRYSSEVSWNDTPSAAAHALEELEAAAHSLGTLTQWAYTQDRYTRDRLTVLRTEFARSLESHPAGVDLHQLLTRAESLGKRVRTAWESFIQGKLDVYYSRVREVEQTVDETAKAYREQIGALCKSLTESALAAVGVIVGSFIAAVFSDKINLDVFRLGLGVYAVYLLIFPGIIGLTSSRQHFREIVSGFGKRREAFKPRLAEEEINSIVGDTLTKGENRYDSWFKVSVAVYPIVAN